MDVTPLTGLLEVYYYVVCHQNEVEQYIFTRAIMDQFLAADQRPRTRVYKQWWQQEGLYREGMRTATEEEDRE